MFSVSFRNQECCRSGDSVVLQRKICFHQVREPGIADLAWELTFGSVVLVEKWFRASQRGQVQESGISHSERRLIGRIFLP